MAKVKDGKIIKKNLSQIEQRNEIIKNRAKRTESEAEKQGISVDELKKKRSDTFSTVLSPLTMLPIGRAASLIGKVGPKISKFLKGSSKTKTPKIDKKLSKTTPKNTKPKSDAKPTTETKTKLKDMGRPRRNTGRSRRKMKDNTPKKKTSTLARDFIKNNKVPLALGAATLGTGAALLSDSKSNKDKKSSLPEVKLKPKNIKPKDTKPNVIKSKPIKKTNITEGGNTGFGAKGNVFVSSEKRRKELMDKFGGTGSAAARAAMKGTQGSMVKRAAGGLKPLPEGNKGLGKLPSPVRNKMGYMKKGGIVKMRGGGAATRGMNFNRGR